MARNVEIKAKVPDMATLEARAVAVAGAPEAVLHQRDSYFASATGRLKLREIRTDGVDDTRAELIFYRRPDTEAPSLSDYLRIDVPNPVEMAALLAESNGRRLVVEKVRTLHWHGRTRIHLDCVAGLGDYMELEVTLGDSDTQTDGEQAARSLMAELGIESAQLESRGYADLLGGLS